MFRFFTWIISNSIKLIFVVACVIMCAMGWLLIDGLNDSLTSGPDAHTDVALVLVPNITPNQPLGDVIKERLDKAIELYKLGLFKSICVVGSNHGNKRGQLGVTKYFSQAHVPTEAVIENSSGFDVDESVENFEKICAAHHFKSVTLITHYYAMTRAKLSLRHYGIQDIRQEHAGHLALFDWWVITRDFAAFLIYETEYECDSFVKKVPGAVDELESTIGSKIKDRL